MLVRKCGPFCLRLLYSRYGALSSLEGLVHYLGLHITPDDPTFCPDHRAQLCYVGHVISVVLKNSVVTGDTQAGTNTRVCTYVHTYMYVLIPAFASGCYVIAC